MGAGVSMRVLLRVWVSVWIGVWVRVYACVRGHMSVWVSAPVCLCVCGFV